MKAIPEAMVMAIMVKQILRNVLMAKILRYRNKKANLLIVMFVL